MFHSITIIEELFISTTGGVISHIGMGTTHIPIIQMATITFMEIDNETILIVWQTCDLSVGVNRNNREKVLRMIVGNT